MPTIDLPIGPVDYRDLGPRAVGAPIAVFVHGSLVNATLWDPVAERLAADGVRCILPDWPLGAHRRPANPDAALSPIAGSKQIPADYASPKGRAQAGVLCARVPAVWGDGIGILGATFRGAFQEGMVLGLRATRQSWSCRGVWSLVSGMCPGSARTTLATGLVSAFNSAGSEAEFVSEQAVWPDRMERPSERHVDSERVGATQIVRCPGS